ncbi:MAG: thiol:disulfide oxidoreductase [Deltaproteobacteria bacterium]|jgi:GST-like protein|nr:thiol:disulfide oxidoreductase [Deltaproteobacteria bacterium]
MIDFYGLPTPNCWKVSIALEEAGFDYAYTRIDIGLGDQFGEDFTRIHPLQKVPVIVDRDPSDGGPPLTIFESAAILLYLAEKSDRLLPNEGRPRLEVLQWLMWDTSNVGEAHSTRLAFIAEPGSPGSVTKQGAEPIEAAAEFMGQKIRRLYDQLDTRLANREFLCDEFSIADIAAWCHVVSHRVYGVSDGFRNHPNLLRWYRALRGRPALRRGFDLDLEIFEKIPEDFRKSLRDE